MTGLSKICAIYRPQNKHGFLHRMLIFSTPLTEKKADEEPDGLFPGLSVSNSEESQLSFFVQLFNDLFCQRFLVGCRGYVASLLRVFKELLRVFFLL